METNQAPRCRTAATTAPLAVAAVVVAAVLVVATSATSRSRAPAPDVGRCVVALEPGDDLEPEARPEHRSPAAIAVDHRGDLLVADTGNHRVVILDSVGRVLGEYGGYGWDEGQFDGPSDLSIYAGFFTYVLDRGNRRVVRFDVDGLYVDEIVSEGEAGSPVAIAVGRSGELLLVDEDSQSVLLRSQFDEQLEPFGRFGAVEGGLVRPTAIDVGPRRDRRRRPREEGGPRLRRVRHQPVRAYTSRHAVARGRCLRRVGRRAGRRLGAFEDRGVPSGRWWPHGLRRLRRLHQDRVAGALR